MAECTVNLYTHLEFGHILVISLKTKSRKCQSFKINLSSIDEEKSTNIPLQIETNIESNNNLTLSSYFNHSKTNEMCFNVKSLNERDDFKFYLFALDDKFRIALNNDHLCCYDYKSELSNVKVVQIFGEVNVIQCDHRKVYPTPWPLNQEDVPTIAFSCDVPMQFEQNTIVIMRMKLTGSTKGSFFIRFNEMGSKKQLFHFNPRFDEENIVVNCMNDLLEWQSELRCLKFPFELNKEFQLAIFMDSSFFQVAVNGQHLLKFPIKAAQSTMLRQSDSHPIYEKLTGFKAFALNGLKLKMIFVDFFKIKDSDCNFYEIFSNMNFM